MVIDIKIQQALYDFMAQFLTEDKKEKFERIIKERTRHLTVVLEDIYQSHNVSAVLRTCDCYGIQDVHIIENQNKYNLCKEVELGSSKWLNLNRYNKNPNNTLDAFSRLREQGYRIVATSPHKNDQVLDELLVDKKIALVFGNELSGLSRLAMENADEFVKIPLHGFTESFNISVSAAIFITKLIDNIRKSGVSWELTEPEKLEVLLNWTRNVLRNPVVVEKEFFKKNC